MRFTAEEWLAKHGGDPVRALNALHAEVEERESDNATARADKRELKKELDALKDQIKELEKAQPGDGAVVLTKEQADLLKRYQALGDVDKLETEVTDLRQYKTDAEKMLSEADLKVDLLDAGVSKEYIGKALKLIDGDDSLYEQVEEGEGENKKTVTRFSVDKFREENPMFFNGTTSSSNRGTTGNTGVKGVGGVRSEPKDDKLDSKKQVDQTLQSRFAGPRRP